MASKRSASSLRAPRAGKRLRQPPDSEIDFSDSPELTDDQLNRLRPLGRPPVGDAVKKSIAIRINPNLLGKWKRQLEAGQQAQVSGRNGYVAFPGQGQARDEEVSRLKRENVALRMERDVLKKAIGIFVEPKR